MVKSPCTNICAIDYNVGFCMGCKRTIKEITTWSNLDEAEKKQILLKIIDRKFFISKVRKKTSKIETFK
jgi:predicted Fe-S protein YdhL (DUF1289 family)